MQITPKTMPVAPTPVTPNSDSKPKRKRGKKYFYLVFNCLKCNRNKTFNQEQQDVQKNASVILTNSSKAKPQRDYAPLPLLNATQMPKVQFTIDLTKLTNR
jgi:hypothetical protein